MMTFRPSFKPRMAIFDETGILVTVANDQARPSGSATPGRRIVPASLPTVQPEIEGLARVQDFLHDFAELVDLDGEHAAVAALVTKFRDGPLRNAKG